MDTACTNISVSALLPGNGFREDSSSKSKQVLDEFNVFKSILCKFQYRGTGIVCFMILLSKSYTISFLSLSLLPSSYTQHFASSLASLFREGNRTTNADMDRMAFTSITNGISSIKLFGNICTGAVVSVVGQPTFSTVSKYWSSRSDIFSISFNTHRQLCNFECTYNSIMHATV